MRQPGRHARARRARRPWLGLLGRHAPVIQPRAAPDHSVRPAQLRPQHANDAFLEDGVLIREAARLAGIPGVLVNGRNDLGGGVITAWEIARAWPGAELIVIEDSGHTGSASMQEAMHAAADRMDAAITERTAIGRR